MIQPWYVPFILETYLKLRLWIVLCKIWIISLNCQYTLPLANMIQVLNFKISRFWNILDVTSILLDTLRIHLTFWRNKQIRVIVISLRKTIRFDSVETKLKMNQKIICPSKTYAAYDMDMICSSIFGKGVYIMYLLLVFQLQGSVQTWASSPWHRPYL